MYVYVTVPFTLSFSHLLFSFPPSLSPPLLLLKELLSKREHVVQKLHAFEETIDPIVQLFEDPEVQEYLEQKK